MMIGIKEMATAINCAPLYSAIYSGVRATWSVICAGRSWKVRARLSEFVSRHQGRMSKRLQCRYQVLDGRDTRYKYPALEEEWASIGGWTPTSMSSHSASPPSKSPNLSLYPCTTEQKHKRKSKTYQGILQRFGLSYCESRWSIDTGQMPLSVRAAMLLQKQNCDNQ